MESGRDPNIDFTGRELFPMKTDFKGFQLNEIVNNENTRYDNRLKTWGLGNEMEMIHCNEHRALNEGTDWIIYLTYQDVQNSADFYFQFSLIPPMSTDILMKIRGLRKSQHYPIVAYEINLSKKYLYTLRDNYPAKYARLSGVESCVLSPLPSDCKKLTDFMEQCRSWHGSPDLRIV